MQGSWLLPRLDIHLGAETIKTNCSVGQNAVGLNTMKFVQIIMIVFSAIGLTTNAFAESHPLTNFLRKIDRQLCDKYHSSKCRQQKPYAVHSKTKNAPPASPPESAAKTIQPVVPNAVPVPTLKPDPPHQNAEANAPIALPKSPQTIPIPMPTLKPEQLKKISPAPPVPVALPAPDAIEMPADPTCLATLKIKGVNFETVPQPPGLPACIVVQPVKLKSIQLNGLVLKLPDQPTLNCAFALRLVSWLQMSGGPIAALKEGSQLSELNTGPGFQCRGRNGDISAKISEHGFGNAVDVERMKFSDGKVFLVHDAPDSNSAAFETLKAFRASACTSFTTVLGPGANEAHREHFHFDFAVHGKSGTFRICE